DCSTRTRRGAKRISPVFSMTARCRRAILPAAPWRTSFATRPASVPTIVQRLQTTLLRCRRYRVRPRRRSRIDARMQTGRGIALKLVSALLFALMSALIRYLGARYPIGEVVFYRSAFAIVPVVAVYALRGELAAVF